MFWFQDRNDKYLTSCLLPPQDRDTGTPESSTRFPSWGNPPDALPSACPHYGPNAHPHAHTEPAAHTAAGVQGTSVGSDWIFTCRFWFFIYSFITWLCLWMLTLQEQSLLQPPTLQLLNGMGPLGRRASDGGANIQLHAQLLKRPRGPSPLVASPVRVWVS